MPNCYISVTDGSALTSATENSTPVPGGQQEGQPPAVSPSGSVPPTLLSKMEVLAAIATPMESMSADGNGGGNGNGGAVAAAVIVVLLVAAAVGAGITVAVVFLYRRRRSGIVKETSTNFSIGKPHKNFIHSFIICIMIVCFDH